MTDTASDPAPAPTPPPGRRILLGRQLLDRQIVDRDGRLAGKVDDVEIALPPGIREHDAHEGIGDRPVVTTLLSGRQALARRLGGPLGRMALSLSRRVLPDPDEADAPDGDGRIWFGKVTDLGNHVTISDRAADLATHAVEQAVGKTIVDRIPGAKEPGA
jgi:hypothetical protein